MQDKIEVPITIGGSRVGTTIVDRRPKKILVEIWEDQHTLMREAGFTQAETVREALDRVLPDMIEEKRKEAEAELAKTHASLDRISRSMQTAHTVRELRDQVEIQREAETQGKAKYKLGEPAPSPRPEDWPLDYLEFVVAEVEPSLTPEERALPNFDEHMARIHAALENKREAKRMGRA